MIDNRASGGELIEMDAFNCPHCNRTIAMNPKRVRARGFCVKCNRTLCDGPGCNAECNPIEQMVGLAQKYPGEPFLLRGRGGEPLFNRDLKDRETIY